MTSMGRTATKKLTIKKGDFELTLERGDNGIIHSMDLPSDYAEEQMKQLHNQMRTNQALSRGGEIPTTSKAPPAAVKEELNQNFILSPMVGTIYLTPSPEDPPFIKVGEKIEKNSIVCIIEAMKVMNEIKAGMNGTIVEVLVESGQPIEFGTKLFRISE